MPEGPEVEAARRLVERNVLNVKITKAVILDDDKVFAGVAPDVVAQAFEGRCIKAACRKAKYLWFEMEGPGPHPLLHFGMTGSVIVEGVGAAKYKRVTVDESNWPPKFWKLHLEFEDGSKLAFTDPRRFGRVQLLENPRNQDPVAKLGFDVITELPSQEEFVKLFSTTQKAGSSLRIKALLLDQTFTAGVGNWVADEVLYQALIHPEQLVADMPETQIIAVHKAIKEVMEVANAVDADSDQFPKNWLFHYRWTGKKASSINGHAVEFVTVGSRTSAFVPALQKVIAGTGLSKTKPEPKKRTPAKRKKTTQEDDDGESGDAHKAAVVSITVTAADEAVVTIKTEATAATTKRTTTKKSAATTNNNNATSTTTTNRNKTAAKKSTNAKNAKSTTRGRKRAKEDNDDDGSAGEGNDTDHDNSAKKLNEIKQENGHLRDKLDLAVVIVDDDDNKLRAKQQQGEGVIKVETSNGEGTEAIDVTMEDCDHDDDAVDVRKSTRVTSTRAVGGGGGKKMAAARSSRGGSKRGRKEAATVDVVEEPDESIKIETATNTAVAATVTATATIQTATETAVLLSKREATEVIDVTGDDDDDDDDDDDGKAAAQHSADDDGENHSEQVFEGTTTKPKRGGARGAAKAGRGGGGGGGRAGTRAAKKAADRQDGAEVVDHTHENNRAKKRARK